MTPALAIAAISWSRAIAAEAEAAAGTVAAIDRVVAAAVNDFQAPA
jgi:ribosomal protein L18E